MRASLLLPPAILYYVCLWSLVFYGAQSQGYAKCYVFGTQHVLTFDNQRIDFASECEFTLVRTCPPGARVDARFEISVINEAVYQDNPNAVAKAKCVKVVYNGNTALLCNDETAQVNGEPVESLALRDLFIYSGTSGKELIINTSSSAIIQVTINELSTIRISIPSSYQQKVCGLCGNYDGDPTTDLVTAAGISVAAVTRNSDRGALIAQSYFKPDASSTGCSSSLQIRPFTRSNCEAEKDIETQLQALEYCGVYEYTQGAFNLCVTAQNSLAAVFKDICMYDFCENYLTSDTEGIEYTSGCLTNKDCVFNETTARTAMKRIAEVFVEKCRDGGTSLPNWRSDYRSALSCNSGFNYNYWGPKCPLVCGFPSRLCTESNVDGCACPNNQYISGASCLPSNQCACTDPIDGSYHLSGTSWVDDVCSTNFTCDGKTVRPASIACSDKASCSMKDGVRGCYCSDLYAGDGFTCLRQCTRGEQPMTNGLNCENCPIGTYQNTAGQSKCISCGPGLITLDTGATDVTDCFALSMLPHNRNLAITRCVNQIFDQSHMNVIPQNVLPNGLPFGSQTFRTLYVSTNGLISFGADMIGRVPTNIVSSNFRDVVVAPFWFRQDLRTRPDNHRIQNLENQTHLCMSQYNKVDPVPANQKESVSQLEKIRIMLQSSPRLTGISFVPTYALVATWTNSIPYPFQWYDSPAQSESVTYQCVLVSDGVRTFAMFIYPASRQHLVRNDNRLIFMGYNAQDSKTRYMLYLSSSSAITGMDQVPSNTNVSGRWVFEIANTGASNPAAQVCLRWYNYQRLLQSPMSQTCPCDFISAIIDERFIFDFDTSCAYSLSNRGGFYLMCCYDDSSDGMGFGSLLTDAVNAGYPTMYQPIQQEAFFQAVDQTIYLSCCYRSNYCNLFREFRKIPTCSNYRPPRIASGFGDPHISTLDGVQYSYNPVGEFWLIQSPTFSLQARMSQSFSATGVPVQATQFSAFAMKSVGDFNSSTLHIEINNNRTDFIVFVNGVSQTGLLDSSVENALIQFDGGIIKKYNDSITFAFKSDYNLRFSLRYTVLSIQIFASTSDSGNVEGLLGKFDGDPSNDLTSRTGTLICQLNNNTLDSENCTAQKIYYEFGESWRIQQNESLFYYPSGWDTSTFSNTKFVPMFDIPTNSTLAAICNGVLSCIFDAMLTNNTQLGLYSSAIQDEVAAKANTFANKPPTVQGHERINVTVNASATYLFYYVDSENDTGQLVAISKPPNSTFEFKGAAYAFSWTPNNLNPVALRLVASENFSSQSSPQFDVEIRVSPACVHGKPDFSSLVEQTTATFMVVQCSCERGWTGELCDSDFDGCADKPCGQNNCTDVPANLETGNNTFTCSDINCTTGYTKVESACIDLDECATADPPCKGHICVNTKGSYACVCSKGYRKDTLNETCVDFNECEWNTDNCQDICINTNGSYQCACLPGSTLKSDNVTCDRPLSTGRLCAGRWNCSQSCINGTNGEVCACQRGLLLGNDSQSCIPLNECLNSSTNACDSSSGAQCQDLPSGYQCVCPNAGFTLSDNLFQCEECQNGRYGTSCSETCACGDRAAACDKAIGCTDCTPGWNGSQCSEDINECTASVSPCPKEASCNNTQGSYFCTCPAGYLVVSNGTHTECKDVDECLEGPCSSMALCKNAIGSYSCTCQSGYEGTGKNCADINECLKSPCVDTAECKNIPGTYTCSCFSGYQGTGQINGTGCANVNECLESTNLCQANNSRCHDTIGYFECLCAEGFTGDGAIACKDINECSSSPCANVAVNGFRTECKNTDGSYYCEPDCGQGFKLSRTQDGNATCVDFNECERNGTCSESAYCNNTYGSYRCSCLNGYTGNGSYCEDINECVNGNICTGFKKHCANSAGSFSCICEIGYEPDNDVCVDVNECASSVCASVANCTNTNGSYLCACWPGYSGNGIICADINECNDGKSCNDSRESCLNTDGSFSCDCKIPQYKLPDCLTVSDKYVSFPMKQSLSMSTKLSGTQEIRDALKHLFFGLPGLDDIVDIVLSEPNNGVVELTYTVILKNSSDTKDANKIGQIVMFIVANNDTIQIGGQSVQIIYTVYNNSTDIPCERMTCRNGGTCQHENSTGLSFCKCTPLFNGYDCSEQLQKASDPLNDLLPLWISVAVAGALLFIGIFACVFVVLYRRRSSAAQLHRSPPGTMRGPAIFNPPSRLPAEAFNYQFPRGGQGTITSLSSSDSSSSATSQSQSSRFGTTVPYAPRWPRAYYSQLGDVNEKDSDY